MNHRSNTLPKLGVLVGVLFTCIACSGAPDSSLVDPGTTEFSSPKSLWSHGCFDAYPCPLQPVFDQITGEKIWDSKVYQDPNLDSVVVLVDEVNKEAGRFSLSCPDQQVSLLSFKEIDEDIVVEEFTKAGWFSGMRTAMASLPADYNSEILSRFCSEKL